MLTLSEILKVRQFEEQYGPSEKCFSPDKHGEQPPAELPALKSGRAGTEKVIRLILTREVLASGDVVLVPTYVDQAGQTEVD